MNKMLLCLSSVILILLNCSSTTIPIVVESNPSGVSVDVNKYHVGKTPLKVFLKCNRKWVGNASSPGGWQIEGSYKVTAYPSDAQTGFQQTKYIDVCGIRGGGKVFFELKSQKPKPVIPMNTNAKTNTVSKINSNIENVVYFEYKLRDQVYHKKLKAKINNTIYTLIDSCEKMCLNIVTQKDFDNNGIMDVLVENVIGCGGNCCGNSYFFITYLGNGDFVRSKEFGYSWAEPEIKPWRNQLGVYVTSNNEGLHTDMPEELNEVYILDGAVAKNVLSSKRRTVKSESDIRSNAFDNDTADETLIYFYDLNNDSISDTVTTIFWSRWGRMLWSVNFSDGSTYESDYAAKRIGILKSSTNNVTDLVLDQDVILKWDGKTYRETIEN